METRLERANFCLLVVDFRNRNRGKGKFTIFLFMTPVVQAILKRTRIVASSKSALSNLASLLLQSEIRDDLYFTVKLARKRHYIVC